MKNDLINNLLKRTAVKGALGGSQTETGGAESSSASQSEKTSVHSSLDLFKLPKIPEEFISEDEDDPESDSESSVQLSPRKQSKWIGNIHSVDVSSAEFKALPADVRHDILTDLKATRKQNSWGRLHEMPEQSHDFSNYQMKRLLKRRNVQECLEQAEREMGGKTMTLEELDILLTEQGIATTTNEKSSRIAADNLTRFVYINGSKKDPQGDKGEKGSRTEIEEVQNSSGEDDVKIVENLREYELDNDWESDWESSDDQETTAVKSKEFKKLIKASDVNPAMAYMLEHSGLSQEEILCIIEQNRKKSDKEFDRISKPGTSRDTKSVKEVTESGENSRSSGESDVSKDFVVLEADFSSQKPEVEILSEKVVEKEESESGEEEMPVAVASISDSESDDFVEVEDVPLAVTTSFTKIEKQALEIAIVPEAELEEDMFADVFATGENTVSEKDSPVVEESAPLEAEERIERFQVLSEEDETSSPKVAKEVLKDEDKPDLRDREEETAVVDEPIAGNEAEAERKDRVKEEDDRKKKDAEKKESSFKFPVQREELLTMQAQLENEEKELSGNLGRLERQATDITDQMRMEAQELLRLFGIPYVIAPMEAEAQCAYLETINLTEGTITDDSDIWLFGGRCVYKNFFNLNKHVLQFRSSDIRHHFKLSREQMVQLALLVGSDYTIGVSGIGPVTALEILGAFPAEEGNLLRGLTNFRLWINSGRAPGPGRTSLRTKLKNVSVERGFPSEAVAQAYLAPAVDDSREAFTWNNPNAVLLCDFTREKFGWTKHKFELLFNPIVKRQSEPRKQKGIDSYFDVKISQKSIEGNLSKRVQKAVQQLGDEAREPEAAEKPKRRNKRRLEPVAEEGSATDSITGALQPAIIINKAESATVSEFIPQREKDKANALKKKLRAIEVFRKSKKGPGRTKRTKRAACKIKESAELSESSDSS